MKATEPNPTNRVAEPKAPNRIKEWRELRRMSLAELARQAGTSAQQMGRLEAGKRRLTVGWMEKLAGPLGVSPAELMPGPSSGPTTQPLRAGLPHVNMARDLPVYLSRRGSDGGMMVRATAVEWIIRPEPLLGVIEGFAIRVIDGSTEPVYHPGDLLLAHPGLEPLTGQDVVLMGAESDAGSPALVGRLVDVDSEGCTVERGVPAQRTHAARSAWPRVAVVVGCFRRL